VRTSTIGDELARQRSLATLEPADLDLLAGCARLEVHPAGTFLAREGQPADRFWVLRRGRVAVELATGPAALVIETRSAGDVVGWSWIFPPHRWVYDVVVAERAHVVRVDTACLLDKCDRDPAFGYRLMRCFAGLVVAQLEATRLRLLDLYAGAGP